MDSVTDMFVKLMDEIHQNTSALKDMLANHEARISVLERLDDKKGGEWKVQLLLLLAKATIIGLISIASLVGAGSLVAKTLNVGGEVASKTQSIK